MTLYPACQMRYVPGMYRCMAQLLIITFYAYSDNVPYYQAEITLTLLQHVCKVQTPIRYAVGDLARRNYSQLHVHLCVHYMCCQTAISIDVQSCDNCCCMWKYIQINILISDTLLL